MIDPSNIFSTIDQAAGLDDLKERLAERGIECQFVQAPGAAEPTGWSLRTMGPAGAWIKGSDVDRSLSLKKVRERIEQRLLERRRRHVREILGDLLDDIDQADKVEADKGQESRQLALGQRSLIGALVSLPFEVLKATMIALANAIAALIEKLFGLPAGSMGRLEVDQRGQAQAVTPVEPPADSTAQQLAQLAAAQRIMAAALARMAEAIEQRDLSKLPGARVKDAEMQEAREAVIQAAEDDDQDDEQQYERERM